MSRGGQYGKKYCSNCKKILYTSVKPGSTKNVVVHGLEAKKRQIECNTCHSKWFTVEVIEDDFDNLLTCQSS